MTIFAHTNLKIPMDEKSDLDAYNVSFINEACDLLTDQLQLGTIISPTNRLCDYVITPNSPAKAAGQLTIGNEKEITDFWRRPISKETKLLKNVKHEIKDFFKNIENNSKRVKCFFALEMECWSSIVTALTRRRSTTVRNETELRYCIGDPIINFLSDLGEYKVRICSNKEIGMQRFLPFRIQVKMEVCVQTEETYEKEEIKRCSEEPQVETIGTLQSTRASFCLNPFLMLQPCSSNSQSKECSCSKVSFTEEYCRLCVVHFEKWGR